jgi:hypothetical protein
MLLLAHSPVRPGVCKEIMDGYTPFCVPHLLTCRCCDGIYLPGFYFKNAYGELLPSCAALLLLLLLCRGSWALLKV